MTDDDLKALVASIAEGQKKTDAQLQRTDEQLQRTDAQLQRTDAQLQRTDAQLQRTDEQLQQTAAQLRETDAQCKKTEIQVQKTCDRVDRVARKVDKLASMYGGMSNNQGAVTEEFYFNTLKDNPVLQGMQFDIVWQNISAKAKGIEDEFDILLTNGSVVYIIDVKYKVHHNDIENLIHVKAKNFKTLFPIYQNYEHHFGIACFQIDHGIKQTALAAGVNILQRKGNVLEAIAAKKISL